MIVQFTIVKLNSMHVHVLAKGCTLKIKINPPLLKKKGGGGDPWNYDG